MAGNPIPEGYSVVTPYLIVSGAAGLIEFVETVFDGKERMRMAGDDRAIQHGEVEIGDSRIMLADATPESSPMPAMLHVYVEDVDAVYRRALEAGAESLREPADQFYGDRMAGVKDPFGNQWWIATRVEDVSPEEMERRQHELAG